MNWLIGKLLRWSVGDIDARVLSSELEESYSRLVAAEGNAAANRWRRKEMLRAAFLFEVDPLDPLTLISVTLMLAAAAMAASYLPARRAAMVDPVEALRRE